MSPLPSLRPALIRAAPRLRRCSWDDAEDLVSQTVLIALRFLPEYQPKTGREGLRVWLRTILNWVIRKDRERAAREVETAPMEAAAGLAAPEFRARSAQMAELFRSLPRHQRLLVKEWLEGFDQGDLAQRHGLHRNTVAVRLKSAFAALRTALPNAETLTYSDRLLDFCSRVSLYAGNRAASGDPGSGSTHRRSHLRATRTVSGRLRDGKRRNRDMGTEVHPPGRLNVRRRGLNRHSIVR